MSVRVASTSLQLIFDAEPIPASDGPDITGTLVIPEYQRPYRWTEVQIKRLLQDYQHYLNDVSRVEASDRYGYYLGSIILHQSDDGSLNIIDGQQRLTTLALIAFVQSVQTGSPADFKLIYDSPESQQQILHNIKWLQDINDESITQFDANKINLTLVVTRSEDDAYRFFETQNTGGVRLSGPDIIKAHHLRAIEKSAQNQLASKWESLGDLNQVVGSLVKGRYWQNLNSRSVPSHRKPSAVRDVIVDELGEATGKGDDIAFGRVVRTYQADGGKLDMQAQQGYEMRQPLNEGVNSIHYLTYFESLRVKYLVEGGTVNNEVSHLTEFNRFYHGLVCHLGGCSFLKALFDSCLLLYISQFGEQHLALAAKKIFRVVYAPRVSNRKSVREDSIPAFIRENPVLDWIAASYTPETCFSFFDHFKLVVDTDNLKPQDNTTKKRFVNEVLGHFDASTKGKRRSKYLANHYVKTLDEKVRFVSTKEAG